MPGAPLLGLLPGRAVPVAPLDPARFATTAVPVAPLRGVKARFGGPAEREERPFLETLLRSLSSEEDSLREALNSSRRETRDEGTGGKLRKPLASAAGTAGVGGVGGVAGRGADDVGGRNLGIT